MRFQPFVPSVVPSARKADPPIASAPPVARVDRFVQTPTSSRDKALAALVEPPGAPLPPPAPRPRSLFARVADLAETVFEKARALFDRFF